MVCQLWGYSISPISFLQFADTGRPTAGDTVANEIPGGSSYYLRVATPRIYNFRSRAFICKGSNAIQGNVQSDVN